MTNFTYIKEDRKMSKDNIDRFYEEVKNDPSLAAKLREGTFDINRFIRNAAEEGRKLGLEFSEEEGRVWLHQNSHRVKGDQTRLLKSKDELSDMQIEAFLSGKPLNLR
jgi:hypothetical protein